MTSTRTDRPREKKHWRRRIVVLDLKFQLKHSLLFAILGGGAAAGGGVLTWSIGQGALFPLSEAVTFSLGSALVCGFFGMRLTHRVAGPVYVMSRCLTTLVSGHFPAMRELRDDDELGDLYEQFRKSLEFLRSRELEEAIKLRRAISQLAAVAQTPAAQESINELDAMCEQKRAMTDRLQAQLVAKPAV